ncbi:MAG TPA: BTAD domain-containing putative transcriptional regulator [Mycobacteriales bacterium]|jgi:DNA-binding SARP family transcriptional activator
MVDTAEFLSRTHDATTAGAAPERRGAPEAGLVRVIQLKVSPPPVESTVVRRPRVESLLRRLIERHRVVCVYASAGAGKTTAVLQAAHELRRPLAWLGVEATDAATGRLLTYLEAALVEVVPSVRGVAAAALAAQLPHAEVAGLLAEAVGDSTVTLVLDDVERFAQEPEALGVVASFARYLPPSARLVIVSRTELPFGTASFLPWIAAVGEEDLAFTVEEAADALTLADRPDVDPVEAIVETGGWVTGVLFEAWRSADHVIGIGGEADPLHGYLATQILAELTPAELDLLVSSAVLPEVTAAAAEAIGIRDAAASLHTLRARRLPAGWDRERRAMRCHPRFREYLLQLLERRGDDELRALRRAYGRLLLSQGDHEEAVEQLLAAGALDEAIDVAERVIDHVIERTDFQVAERWLASLAPVRRDEHLALFTAELMLALAREDYAGGAALADTLARAGRRDEVAGASSRAASLMAWCYLHTDRLDDLTAVVEAGAPGEDLDAVLYAMGVVDDAWSARHPARGGLSGGPLDALVMRVHYDRGRLSLLAKLPTSQWALKAAEAWGVGALLATGRTEHAFELYQRLEESPGVWLTSVIGPELLAELGEAEAAWRLLREGRKRVAASGSVLFAMLNLLTEAELELRLNTDPAAARRALEQVAEHPVGQRYAFIHEQLHTWLGLAHLLSRDDEGASASLQAAVAGMLRGDRILLLPAALVYLAEACWRLGDEDGADRATALALTTAAEQGSNHILLKALSEFPAVLTRRLDLERSPDSPWHELGRALMLRGVQLGDVVGASVHLVEFGRVRILVNGEEARPRIKKSYELLAFLAHRRGHEPTKAELLEALFDGRTDDSAASYLRQASLRLRKAVPDVLDTEPGPGRVRLGARTKVTTESERFEGLLRQASGLLGEDRLRTLLEALEIVDRGDYLPEVFSSWVEERRRQLASEAQDARLDAAEIAFTVDRYRQAARLVREVLGVDPFREAAWRLEMRIAAAYGDQDKVIAAFRDCERALGELGARPAESTVRLLNDLRR